MPPPLQLVLVVAILLSTTTPGLAFFSSHISAKDTHNIKSRHTHLQATSSSTEVKVNANNASVSSSPSLGKPICIYETITIQPSGMNKGESPRQAVSVEDLTPKLQSILESNKMLNGVLHVISRHTTTAITINEKESRLEQDIAQYFLGICPPDERSSSERKVKGVRYLHNDIDKRPDGEEEAQRCRENGWDIDNDDALQKWRDQEPINAHSHLISMMLGSSECIPIVEGKMVIGQWQSVLMVDLDGPRTRTVGVQLLGYE